MSFHVRRLFDGESWHQNVVLQIEGANQCISSLSKEGYEDEQAIPLVIPALIDLQIYGAAGRLLSELPDLETLNAISDYCLNGGVRYFQPTIASQSNTVIRKVIYAVREFISSSKLHGSENSRAQCLGLHLEGPWIHPNKRGAHSLDFVHSPTLEEVIEILDYGKDVISMITVAPEICSPEVLQYISEQNILISAGHTDATYEQAMKAFHRSNIPTATHLYNAMSSFHHRLPGVVGAIFDHPTIMCSVVADGLHVDYAAVRIAKNIMKERLFCITDAVTECHTGPYQHELVQDGENCSDRYESKGILSGSALTQLRSIRNLTQFCRFEESEAIRMCSVYPARLVSKRFPNITGKLQIGESYPFLCLNHDFNIFLQ